ncbi:uncharacterized protein BCR38DRAFT_413825 [Pseudomassariella vexata]|uniref:Uncharacterized protein n=1 Tax=Pseudomassariella vexata TaxID=1141098 RepID=A0A1Y2DDR4_9PEZI|nr:uncharacterized protein BCR38DRAFT_413825 [Pseudomassariella vexata]ORY57422.1 hypothetical protein BCR38DRAFT_413825 [Pseudomassariella vexata]
MATTNKASPLILFTDIPADGHKGPPRMGEDRLGCQAHRLGSAIPVCRQLAYKDTEAARGAGVGRQAVTWRPSCAAQVWSTPAVTRNQKPHLRGSASEEADGSDDGCTYRTGGYHCGCCSGVPVCKFAAGYQGSSKCDVDYLLYDTILPYADECVSNAGYSAFTHAAVNGVPIVVVGESENEKEISKRTAWPGLGVDLETQTPSMKNLRDGIEEILENERHKKRAIELIEENRSMDSLARIEPPVVQFIE